jgi:alkyl sulfatase BDS1-like metallo-beta-lactamase superfamily hydrolase
MMDQGLAPAEIAEALTAPPGLENDWSTRGYYGTRFCRFAKIRRKPSVLRDGG